MGDSAVAGQHRAATAGPSGHGRQTLGPVRSGAAPPLAEGFSVRPETGPVPVGALTPGLIVALTGPKAADAADLPGGTGKTQFAAYLAGSLWQARQIDFLVWVTATSRASVLASYAQAFAEITGAPVAHDDERAAARLLVWLAQTSQPWLVVLDDLAAEAGLDGLWPQGPTGRVLVTTRDPAALPGARNPLVFGVGEFSSHEALTYLLGRLSADPDQRIGAVDLLAELGCEPLALAQASATISSSGMNCRDYRDLFARRKEQVARTLGAEPPGKAVTWTLSVEQAGEMSPGKVAESCLGLASLLDGHGIPGAVFTAPAVCDYVTASRAAGPPDPKHAESALLSLQRAGLLTIDGDSASHTVRVHPAVQAAVRAVMPDVMRDRAALAAANGLLEVWPADDVEPWLEGALRSCAASLQQTAADSLWATGCHPLLVEAGRSLDRTRLTGPAVAHWRELAVLTERMLGPAHPNTLAALGRLATASLAAGVGAESVQLYQRILDARANAPEPLRPSTLAVRAGLGKALLAAGLPLEAVNVLEAVLRSCERAQVPDDVDRLAVQDSLAAANHAAGRHEEAIQLGKRTLAARERRQPSDHPDTMTTRGNLASAYLAAGKLKDAIAAGKRTFADRERVLGPDHLDTIAAVSMLATANHSARRLRDAVPLYERALADRERVQGSDHPDTLGARGNLASAYHSAGRMATALECYERTRADCARVLGPYHPDTLAARANLAHAYYAVGRLPDALTMLQTALADCERVLAPDDPLTAAVRDSLNAVAQEK